MSMRDSTGGLPGSYRARSQTPSKAIGGIRLCSGSIFEESKVVFIDVVEMISKGRMDCNRKGWSRRRIEKTRGLEPLKKIKALIEGR